MAAISRPRCIGYSAIIFLALTAFPLNAFAADTRKGEIIAKRWCAACHLVATDQTLANSDTPSFAAIARKKLPAAQLTAFLTDPHPKMPNMSLSRSEIADIVAYIKSLD
jgi:mono/diheme cytochrome c family protein